MRFHPLVSLVAGVTLAGCWIGDTPAPELPQCEVQGQGGCEQQVCDCLQGAPEGAGETGLDGRVYRFTEMRIEEPYALAGLLNDLWENDIDKHILNVMFVIGRARPSETGYPLHDATLDAASGWRDPPELVLDEGQAVESYCVLPGTRSPMTLVPKTDCSGKCEVETQGRGELNFFAGSMDAPLNCSPDLEVPNSIPVRQVEASFVFDDDCTRIIHGRLTACLRRDEAMRICMCLRMPPDFDYTCTMAESPDMPELGDEPTATELNDYCSACGDGQWMALGGILPPPAEGTDLPPCDPPIGDAGYKVTGVFTGEDVTRMFNPVESGDCTER